VRAPGKVVVVTGGGDGIGRQLVLCLLARGAMVAAVDLRPEGLNETVRLAAAPESLSTHTVDVTDREAVERLPELVVAAHGAVDGVINNAGIIQPFVRVRDLGYDVMDRVMAVNFYGTVFVTRAFLPLLLGRPEAHVVNVSSMGGFLPVPGQTIYGASKAAVKLFTEGLRSELLDTNVRVTLALPGAVATNIVANSGVAMPPSGAGGASRFMRPLAASRAAEMIVGAMERDRYRVLVGRDAVAMDLLYRVSPQRAAELIFRQMRALLG
jgi:NAD(P)-dependent dehydrogenase (short-subunit alcohol dehydrogenase family)